MSTSRGFKPLATIAASDADLDAFVARKGVPALSHSVPASAVTAQAPSPLALVKPSAVLRRVTLDLPEYVVDQLHDRARSARCTTRHVVMSALKTTGVTIYDEDMISDGRRLR